MKPLRLASALAAATAMFATLTLPLSPASAAEPSVGLGTADSFAVLAYSTVTNTGPSVIGGDVGVSPGTAITGFPPGVVVDGTAYGATPESAAAQAALGTAFGDAAGRGPGAAVAQLGGLTLAGGIYTGGGLGLTGTLVLDAGGDVDSVWIFQAASTLITASGSGVVLQNGANPCNVFWQVGSSATLGTGTDFVGTVMAQASIAANTGARVEGRLLARTGAVTLDTNVVTLPDCVPTAITPDDTTTTTAIPDDTTTTTVTPDDTTTTTVTPDDTTTTTVTPDDTTTTTVTPDDTTTTTEAPDTTPTTVAAAGGTTTTTEAPADTTTTTVAAAGGTTATTTAPATWPTTEAPAGATTGGLARVPTNGVVGQVVAPVPGSPAAGSPSGPTALAAPAAPTGSGASTPRAELPKTGAGLTTTAGVGVLTLLLGELMVRRSRRLAQRPA